MYRPDADIGSLALKFRLESLPQGVGRLRTRDDAKDDEGSAQGRGEGPGLGDGRLDAVQGIGDEERRQRLLQDSPSVQGNQRLLGNGRLRGQNGLDEQPLLAVGCLRRDLPRPGETGNPQAQTPQRAREPGLDDTSPPEHWLPGRRVFRKGHLFGPDQDAHRRSFRVRLVFGKRQSQRTELRMSLPAAPDETVPAPTNVAAKSEPGRESTPLAPDFDEASPFHDTDAVGDLESLLLVVGDENGRDLEPSLDLVEAPSQLRSNLDVQRAEGLVQEKDLGLVGERPRQGHALLLSAGELVGVAVAQSSEADEVEQLLALAAPLGSRHAPDPQAKGDVLRRGHVLEDRVVLEDETDAALLGGKIRHVRPLQLDAPSVRGGQAGDHAQDRALAAAARAQEDGELPVGDLELHAFDDGAAGEALGEPVQDDRHGCSAIPRRALSCATRSGRGRRRSQTRAGASTAAIALAWAMSPASNCAKM